MVGDSRSCAARSHRLGVWRWVAGAFSLNSPSSRGTAGSPGRAGDGGNRNGGGDVYLYRHSGGGFRPATFRRSSRGEWRRSSLPRGRQLSAGTPLVRLSAEQEQADVDAALARTDVAQAAQRRAESGNWSRCGAERDRVQAEINLEEEQFSRTTALVERGALAQGELDLNQRDLAVARADLKLFEPPHSGGPGHDSGNPDHSTRAAKLTCSAFEKVCRIQPLQPRFRE